MLRTNSKALERQKVKAVVKRIGTVTLFRDKLNVSKFSARRISRSRETQTKEFDQAGSDLGSTVFENKRRDFILPRIKVSSKVELIAKVSALEKEETAVEPSS